MIFNIISSAVQIHEFSYIHYQYKSRWTVSIQGSLFCYLMGATSMVILILLGAHKLLALYKLMDFFYTRGRIIRLDELGQTFVVLLVCVFNIKMGTRRIMRLDELSFVIRPERRTMEDSLSTQIMRLVIVPVSILETHTGRTTYMFAQVRPDG